jgi:hypothetical protein
MDRRTFLTITAGAAATPALLSAHTQPAIAAALEPALPLPTLAEGPAVYRVSGTVRVHEPIAEISGITNSQSISWSDWQNPRSIVASFVTFEELPSPDAVPAITVRGGRLESVEVTPVF